MPDATIEIRCKPHVLSYPAFVLFFPLLLIAPRVRVTGGASRIAWWFIPCRIPVDSGDHEVTVALFSIIGGHRSHRQVSVAAGETARLDYRAPATVYGTGRLVDRRDPVGELDDDG